MTSVDYLLVVIDKYSTYPVFEIAKSTSGKATVPKLDKIFAQFGISLQGLILTRMLEIPKFQTVISKYILPYSLIPKFCLPLIFAPRGAKIRRSE